MTNPSARIAIQSRSAPLRAVSYPVSHHATVPSWPHLAHRARSALFVSKTPDVPRRGSFGSRTRDAHLGHTAYVRPTSAFVPCAGLGSFHVRYTTVKRSGRRGRSSMTSWGTVTRRPDTSSSTRVGAVLDRKSTRLNSSHGYISYAVFCLKKKKLMRH